jgi:hypothetical protein
MPMFTSAGTVGQVAGTGGQVHRITPYTKPSCRFSGKIAALQQAGSACYHIAVLLVSVRGSLGAAPDHNEGVATVQHAA